MDYSFYIGNDISKEWFDVAVLNAQTPRKTDHQRFENTEKGFKALMNWLKRKGIKDLSLAFFCLEHTGVYSVPFCRFLSKKGANYSLIPGSEIKESLGITRGKSDQVDAKRIAQYAYKNKDFMRIHTLPTEVVRKLKACLSYRDRLIKSRHGFMVSAKELKAHETEEVSNRIFEGSQLMIEQINDELSQLEEAIDQLIKQHPELKRNYDLLLSVPGIGVQVALHLIVSTQNFVCFNCPKKFAAYSGIAPFKSDSGKSIKSRSKVSHKANKKMKTLLSIAVVNSIRRCPDYRLYFEKQLKKGKHENSIKNVIRNKIVSRAFAVIKRNSPYENRHTFAA
ncbi:MAG: IS110 family transposase [Lewinellaceae bacterium]|nr:IS110 family transposase [Lewinellaceae bacterium]